MALQAEAQGFWSVSLNDHFVSQDHLRSIAARRADIVNMIPPTADGKDFIKDQEATVRFDRARMRQRIAKLHQLATDAGRDPAENEISGFVLANLSGVPEQPVFGRLAQRMGFPDLESARRSPVALIDTPDQAIQELHERVGDGVGYFIVVATSPETQRLPADEVLPVFSRPGRTRRRSPDRRRATDDR